MGAVFAGSRGCGVLDQDKLKALKGIRLIVKALPKGLETRPLDANRRVRGEPMAPALKRPAESVRKQVL